MMGSSLRGTICSIDVKSTCNNSPGPLQSKGFIGMTGGAATALFNVVSEVSSHAWPPEAFLHKDGRVALALVCCLSVATIQSGTPMPLRNYKLEHNLVGLSLLGLPVQEAVLDQELLLCLNVGGCSLLSNILRRAALKVSCDALKCFAT